MSTAPPASLLRLREADVVRLCGFGAAARGLELADRRAVAAGRREGGRLEATVADETPCQVEAELAGEGAPPALRWRCSADAGAPGGPGCSHVAALLTAWIRAPGDFAEADAAASRPAAPAAPVEHPPPERPRVSQPALMTPRGAARPRAGGRLADELARLPTAELLALARRILGKELSEHEARAEIAAALGDPARVAALLGRLDEGPRRLLAYLVLLGGAVTAADLDALATRANLAPSAAQADVAALTRHGFAFAAPGLRADEGLGGQREAARRDQGAGPRWRALAGWRIPPEVRAALAPPLPIAPLPQRDPPGPPLLIGEGGQRAGRVERSSVRPLCLALALLARAPRPLGPFRGADAEVGERMERAPRPGASSPRVPLLVTGDGAPGRLAELARTAGVEPALAAMARRVLLWAREQAPGQPLTDLARVPAGGRIHALRVGFRLWRDAEEAAELADLDLPGAPIRARFDTAHAAFRPAAIAAEVAGARRFVLQLLAHAEPGAWYALDDFAALAWRLDPLFLRGRQHTYATPAWWLERAEGARRPLRTSVREEWMAGEGAYLRLLLSGPLRWWGALDLARDAGGPPVAFRMTPFGRFLLDDGRGEPPEGSDGIEAALAGAWGPPALPTLEGDLAVQPLAAGAGLLDAIERWARPMAARGGRLIYALAPDLVCAAFDRDASPEELPERLRAAGGQAGGRVAGLAARRLGEWRAAYGRTRIAEGWALLEARDEPTLVEALALAPEVAARCRKLGATCALVPSGDLPALRAILARRGYAV